MIFWEELKSYTPAKQYSCTLGVNKYNIIDSVCTLTIQSSNWFKSGDAWSSTYTGKFDDCIATVCCWVFSLDGVLYYGRSLDDFVKFLSVLCSFWENGTLAIYVHDLGFAFTFLSSVLEFSGVFGGENKPLYAESGKLLFRDSFALTNQSLIDSAALCGCSVNFDNVSFDGVLPWDALTAGELLALEARATMLDGIITFFKNDDKLKPGRHGHVANIALTQTAYVKKTLRTRLYSTKYYNTMRTRSSYIDFEDFKRINLAFRGGYIYANPLWAREELDDVVSYDMSSAYAYQLVTRRFPCGKFKRICDPAAIENNLFESDKKRSCFYGLLYIGNFHKIQYKTPYLTKDKCAMCNCSVDAFGHILDGESLYTWVTDADYFTIRECYEGNFKFDEFYVAPADYLHSEVVLYMLDLYTKKTVYKGDASHAVDYKFNKVLLNSVPGLFECNFVRPTVSFNNGKWVTETLTEDREREVFESSTVFLGYIGAWITAYQRRDLVSVINKITDLDFVYCDTDSVKFTNHAINKRVIQDFNNMVINRLRKTTLLRFFNNNSESWLNNIAPKNIHGERVVLGCFYLDAEYEKFATAGPKVYEYVDSHGCYDFTISGMLRLDNRGNKTINKFGVTTERTEIPDAKLIRKKSIQNNSVLLTGRGGVQKNIVQLYSTVEYRTRFVINDFDIAGILGTLESLTDAQFFKLQQDLKERERLNNKLQERGI